jgi:hypothetical protein
VSSVPWYADMRIGSTHITDSRGNVIERNAPLRRLHRNLNCPARVPRHSRVQFNDWAVADELGYKVSDICPHCAGNYRLPGGIRPSTFVQRLLDLFAAAQRDPNKLAALKETLRSLAPLREIEL